MSLPSKIDPRPPPPIALSKVFEKTLEDLMAVKYDDFQHGGCKGKGTLDNWFIMMAILDEGKRLKKNIYMYFGDLVKCFDRLWSKDCLIDLNAAGARNREVRNDISDGARSA